LHIQESPQGPIQHVHLDPDLPPLSIHIDTNSMWGERWGAGVETQKYVRGDIGGWGRVPFNETYAPS